LTEVHKSNKIRKNTTPNSGRGPYAKKDSFNYSCLFMDNGGKPPRFWLGSKQPPGMV